MKEWQHSIIEKTNKANLYDQLLQAQGDELVETLVEAQSLMVGLYYQ
jgi:hypothetical protein